MVLMTMMVRTAISLSGSAAKNGKHYGILAVLEQCWCRQKLGLVAVINSDTQSHRLVRRRLWIPAVVTSARTNVPSNLGAVKRPTNTMVP